jgi:hypothetical protein
MGEDKYGEVVEWWSGGVVEFGLSNAKAPKYGDKPDPQKQGRRYFTEFSPRSTLSFVFL